MVLLNCLKAHKQRRKRVERRENKTLVTPRAHLPNFSLSDARAGVRVLDTCAIVDVNNSMYTHERAYMCVDKTLPQPTFHVPCGAREIVRVISLKYLNV